MFNLASEQKMK